MITRKSININKKAAIDIWAMIFLMTTLLISTFVIIYINKDRVDSAVITADAPAILLNRESQLNAQLNEITIQIAASAYDNVMNAQIFTDDNGNFVQEPADAILNSRFKKEFISQLTNEMQNYISSQNELSPEMNQTLEALKNDSETISFDNENLNFEFKNIKITIIQLDEKMKKELFRGIYTSNIAMKINLISIGLSKLSILDIVAKYQECKKQNDINTCLNSKFQNFNYIITQETTPADTVTYITLTTRQKFTIGKEYRSIIIKLPVDTAPRD